MLGKISRRFYRTLTHSSSPRPTHYHPDIPTYVHRPPTPYSPDIPRHLRLKTHQETQKIRKSCQIAAKSLNFAQSLVEPGISTAEIDRLVHKYITVEWGAYPSPLGYGGFPRSICTSVNNVICHGLPRDDVILMDGDLVSIDVTVYFDGYHGDTCATFLVGGQESQTYKGRLLSEFNESAKFILNKAISQLAPGKRLSDLASDISWNAKKNRLNVIPEIMGHGIGKDFHELPYVCHSHEYYDNDDGDDDEDDQEKSDEIIKDLILKPGMVFTVEPAFVLGNPDFEIWTDGWSVVTIDNSPAVQFEHTVLITDSGVEILTAI